MKRPPNAPGWIDRSSPRTARAGEGPPHEGARAPELVFRGELDDSGRHGVGVEVADHRPVTESHAAWNPVLRACRISRKRPRPHPSIGSARALIVLGLDLAMCPALEHSRAA
jgi:hypothetical protein